MSSSDFCFRASMMILSCAMWGRGPFPHMRVLGFELWIRKMIQLLYQFQTLCFAGYLAVSILSYKLSLRVTSCERITHWIENFTFSLSARRSHARLMQNNCTSRTDDHLTAGRDNMRLVLAIWLLMGGGVGFSGILRGEGVVVAWLATPVAKRHSQLWNCQCHVTSDVFDSTTQVLQHCRDMILKYQPLNKKIIRLYSTLTFSVPNECSGGWKKKPSFSTATSVATKFYPGVEIFQPSEEQNLNEIFQLVTEKYSGQFCGSG